jgi:hypothetical protein
MRKHTLLLAMAAAAFIPLLAACGNDPVGLNPYDGEVEVPPLDFATQTLTLGLEETANLQKYLEISREAILAPIDDVTWQSSDEATVVVSASGMVRGVAIGYAAVSATVEGHIAMIGVQVVAGGGIRPPDEKDAVG